MTGGCVGMLWGYFGIKMLYMWLVEAVKKFFEHE